MEAMRVYEVLHDKTPPDGLYPTFISPDTGLWGNDFISIGALGDSFYEYLLKCWLLTGKTAEGLLKWYVATAEAIAKLLVRSYEDDMLYVATRTGPRLYEDRMDHLACFTGGMFALGASQITTMSNAQASRHLNVGQGLGRFCYEMYRTTQSGLPCDAYSVSKQRRRLEPVPAALAYVQRPGTKSVRGRVDIFAEAVETWFYLWRLTKEPRYREWGWKYFEVRHELRACAS